MLIDEQSVILSKDDAARLKLHSGDGLLSCGRKTVPVHFQIGSPAGSLGVSLQVLELLALRGAGSSITIGLYRGTDGVPRLGPVVGALSNFPPQTQPDESASLYAWLAQKSLAQGIFFHVFLPEDIDFATRTTAGFVASSWAPDGFRATWGTRSVPLPDIILNRVTTVDASQAEPYGRIAREYGRRPGGHPCFLTRGWLNKSNAMRLVLSDDQAARYAPRTVTLAGLDDLWGMLDEFGQVFLKPVGGSHGLNVIRLTLAGSDIVAEYRMADQNLTRPCASREEVAAIVKPALEGAPYVCQQAIDRPAIDGAPVDFRVGLARNGRGAWEVFYHRGKRAQQGAICTNQDYGGSFIDLEDALEQTFPGRSAALKLTLDQCAMDVARAVSGVEAGDCCVIAEDIALDRRGHPWVLAVNDRPSLGGSHSERGRRDTLRLADLLVQYISLLAVATGKSLVRLRPLSG